LYNVHNKLHKFKHQAIFKTYSKL